MKHFDCIRIYTFRTSSSVADTPGFVGMMSFDPRTVDKFGGLVTLSSFKVLSEDGLVILFWDEEITELDCSVVDAPWDECTLTLDAFFANDLSAAAKDDAWGFWLVSVNFKDEALLFNVGTLVVIGIGVSQCLEGNARWLFIFGMFNDEEGGFITEAGVANDVIFEFGFVEDAMDGSPKKTAK